MKREYEATCRKCGKYMDGPFWSLLGKMTKHVISHLIGKIK